MGTGSLPSGTAIRRVALTVADRETVTEFYRSVVGLDVHRADEDCTVLGDGERALLELHHRPDAPARKASATGLYHVAFRVPSRAALGDALQRIETEWELDGVADHVVSEALYLSDPAGNGVEIYCDRAAETWTDTPSGDAPIRTEPLDLSDLRSQATGTTDLPVGTDVGHVHFEVSDIQTARSFYVDALGMRVRATYDGALFLAAGSYHHHIAVNVWGNRSEPAEGQGLRWVALSLPDEDALTATRDRFRRAGYDVSETATGFSVTDGDGIQLRLRS